MQNVAGPTPFARSGGAFGLRCGYADGMTERAHDVDGAAEPAVEPDAEGGESNGAAGLAGLPLPTVFSPAAFDAAPGDVCGPDGC